MSLERTAPAPTEAQGEGSPGAADSGQRLFSLLGQYAVMQVVIAATGLVRNKVVAHRLGPAAFGEISQIAAVAAVAAALVSFGMSVGLSRNVAACRTLDERRAQLGNANAIVLSLSAVGVIAMLGLLASDRLLALAGLGASRTTVWAAALFVLAIPFEGLKTNYLAVLQGVLDVKGLAIGRSLAVLLATAIAVPVVWVFGFIGAAVQFLLLSVFVTALLGLRCRALGFAPLGVRLELRTVVLLGSFGLVSMVSSLSQVVADTAVRTRLIETSGAAANGLVQAPYALAITLKTVVLASIGSISLSTISAAVDRDEISATVDRLLKVVIPVGTAALAALGLCGVPAITLLYSRSFESSANFFPWLLSADLLVVFVWVVGAPLLGRGDRTLWLALEVLFAVARWGIAIALMPRVGPHAVVIGYLGGVVAHAALNLAVFFFRYRLALAPRHLLRLAFGVAFVAALSVAGAQPRPSVLVMSVAIAGWILHALYHARHGLPLYPRVRLHNR